MTAPFELKGAHYYEHICRGMGRIVIIFYQNSVGGIMNQVIICKYRPNGRGTIEAAGYHMI